MAAEGDPPRRSTAAELAAIPLALVPLALAWLASWALYTYADVGRHRPLFDLFESDRAVFEETFEPPSARPTEAVREPRWTGTPRRPARVVVVGSSPARWDLLKGVARTFGERANLEVFKITANVTPVDRALDRVRTIHSVEPVDVFVVECALSFVNDYILGFRDEVEAFKGDWNPSLPVYDEGVLATIEALGLPERAPGRPNQLRRRREALRRKLDGNRWAIGSDGDRDEWVQLETSATDDPRVLENHLLRYVLARTAAFCRENGIGLVVWVPPAAETLLWYEPAAGARLDPAPFSRRALAAVAAEESFKVFDYHGWDDDRTLFRDAIHLNSKGARELSQRFFGDLAAFLRDGGRDLAYSRVERDRD